MDTTVVTKQGAVAGVLSQDGQTVIFRGVPYAQPPVGKLRFCRPQAHTPWEGVLDCKEFGPRCPQADLTAMDFYSKEFFASKSEVFYKFLYSEYTSINRNCTIFTLS